MPRMVRPVTHRACERVIREHRGSVPVSVQPRSYMSCTARAYTAPTRRPSAPSALFSAGSRLLQWHAGGGARIVQCWYGALKLSTTQCSGSVRNCRASGVPEPLLDLSHLLNPQTSKQVAVSRGVQSTACFCHGGSPCFRCHSQWCGAPRSGRVSKYEVGRYEVALKLFTPLA
ncbi:hypothetical protein EI94DRAFT_434851 [Lactarius quietus]|nr:hypothetical protein EI94DRAFT_434851 [Lactarius quietus]